MKKKIKRNSVRASSRRPDQHTVTAIQVSTCKRHKFLDDVIQRLRDGAEVESVEFRVTLRNSQSPGESTVVSSSTVSFFPERVY